MNRPDPLAPAQERTVSCQFLVTIEHWTTKANGFPAPGPTAGDVLLAIQDAGGPRGRLQDVELYGIDVEPFPAVRSLAA
jgi:hypothetical protein